MTKTFKEQLLSACNRIFFHELPPSEDDIEDLQNVADDEIFAIRKEIEGNRDFIYNEKTRQTISQLSLSYFNFTALQFNKYQELNKKAQNDFSRDKSNEYYLKQIILFDDQCVCDLWTLMDKVINELLEIFIEYFPEVSRKEENKYLFKKYLPKNHSFHKMFDNTKSENIKNKPNNSQKQIPRNKYQKGFVIAWVFMVDNNIMGFEPITMQNCMSFEKITNFFDSNKPYQLYGQYDTYNHRIKNALAQHYTDAKMWLNYWGADQKVITLLEDEYRKFMTDKQNGKS